MLVACIVDVGEGGWLHSGHVGDDDDDEVIDTHTFEDILRTASIRLRVDHFIIIIITNMPRMQPPPLTDIDDARNQQ